MDGNFKQKAFSADGLIRELQGASPLQASKILIQAELFEKKSSIDVLNNVYDYFESKTSLIDELVSPVALNVLDGVITHKKLKLNRTGITASRVWNEIRGFDYSTVDINAYTLSKKQQLEAMRESRVYNKDVRASMTKRSNLTSNKDAHFGENLKGASSIEVDSSGTPVELYRYQNHAKSEGEMSKASDTDHVVPVKQINDLYAKNVFLTATDIAAITDADFNLIEISNELNRMKGAGTFEQLNAKKQGLLNKKNAGKALSSAERKALKKLEGITDETLVNAMETEKKSQSDIHKSAQDNAIGNVKNNKKAIALKAGSQAGEQTLYQALGHAVIEFIKPLFFELNDAIKNGFSDGVSAPSIVEAIKVRFFRVMDYLKKVIIPKLGQAIKDLFHNIARILIEGILGLVTGIFKSVMKIISEGFSALVAAVKILCTSNDQMSAAEKSDAIVKLLASTVATFTVFYFGEFIKPFIPIDFLQDIFLVILSGVASTIVVYLFDKIDIFSVKYEKRSKLVSEIFQERISTIKSNTDSFSAASISELANQKMAFRTLFDHLESGIDDGLNVVENVNSIADFFHIDIQIRDTETFINILRTNKTLVI